MWIPPNCNPATATRANVQITDSLIDSNTAGIYAGGMRLDRADVTISNTLVLKNTVSASGQSYGGGILMASGTAATLTGVTIAGNSAVNLGGGLFIDDGTVISVAQSRIYHNTARSGGGVYVGNIGTSSGTIQSSVLADNSQYQIHEQACSPLQRTILSYQGDVIAPRSGQSDLYFFRHAAVRRRPLALSTLCQVAAPLAIPRRCPPSQALRPSQRSGRACSAGWCRAPRA